eukprot:8421531-Pyramimonas_sp.AAC.1
MCHTPAPPRPLSVTHVSHTRPTSPVERYTCVTHPSRLARRALRMCHTPAPPRPSSVTHVSTACKCPEG